MPALVSTLLLVIHRCLLAGPAAPLNLASLFRLAAFVLALAGGGCASLPGDVQRPESRALGGADTSLARIVSASSPADRPDLSGFRLLADGGDALASRLALIGRAEKSLDVQYYLIASDRTGLEFLAALSGAAARGVRVRILVDDLCTTGQDELLAELAAQANVSVRVFNPLPVRGGSFARRVVFSLHEFSRINRRMHNKLFIADDSFAISGGRNIADAYFDRSGVANFIDMDILSAGPVVRELSNVFDAFWNSQHAYPVQSLVRLPARVSGTLTPRSGSAPAALAVEPTGDARTLAAELAAGRVELRHAPARVLADSLAQLDDTDPERHDSTVMSAHLELVRSARASVLVATPYFVPGAAGLAALSEARRNAVELMVLTNSLSTTDEPLVHFGYARYRTRLLRLGIGLHELMAESEDEAAGGERPGSLGRLHAKLIVVDARWVSVGSMNMDRRSARCNTETALLIDDPLLAAEAAAFLARGRVSGSYRLSLAAGGKRIEWTAGSGGATLRQEPRRPTGARLTPRLASFFISEDML